MGIFKIKLSLSSLVYQLLSYKAKFILLCNLITASNKYVIYDIKPVSYTHLDVYKRQVVEFESQNDVVCEDVQTPSVGSVEDSEEWKVVSGGPGEQLEDEDVQCRDDDLDYVE